MMLDLRLWTRKDSMVVRAWSVPDVPRHWLRPVVPPTHPMQSWAIVRADELCGRLTLRNFHWYGAKRAAHLGLFLRPDLYGCGIGTVALRMFLPRRVVRRVVLEVAADNCRALRCYQKAGFLCTGTVVCGCDGDLYYEMAWEV